jgi:hypothetical protein
MFRQKLKFFGATLALTSLLVLNLHVLAHVFGHDDDDDGPQGKGKAVPCALCQAVLTQHTLAAAPTVEAPSTPLTFMVFPEESAPAREPLFSVLVSTRGPPRALLSSV